MVGWLVAGGKWTTYRSMAEETVDKAVQVCRLPQKRPCCTTGLLIQGAHDWTPTSFIRLIQDFGLDNGVELFFVDFYSKQLARASVIIKNAVISKTMSEEI